MDPNTFQEKLKNVAPDHMASMASSTPPAQPPVSTKSKKSKALIATSVICAILAVGGVAFGVYGMLAANQKSAEPQSQPTASVSTFSESTGNNGLDDNDAAVRELIAELQTVATETSSKDIPGGGSTSIGYIKVLDYGAPIIKKDGLSSLIALNRSYGIQSMATNVDGFDANAIESALVSKLEDSGFVKNEDLSSLPSYMAGDHNYINVDTEIACSISGYPAGMSCGHTSWISEETLSLAKELSEAVNAKNGEYPLTILGNPSSAAQNYTNSQISPYQTLKVPVSNAMGLFYRTDPDADWKFFTATQSVLPCTDYDTDDIKNAFVGDPCYDESAGQDSIVQP